MVNRSLISLGWPHFAFPAADSRAQRGDADAGMSADVVAPLLSVEIDQRQQLLEITDVVTRLENILELLKADQQAA
jgi:hypothetical protein